MYLFKLITAKNITLPTNVVIFKNPKSIQASSSGLQFFLINVTIMTGTFIDDTNISAVLKQSTKAFEVDLNSECLVIICQSDILPINPIQETTIKNVTSAYSPASNVFFSIRCLLLKILNSTPPLVVIMTSFYIIIIIVRIYTQMKRETLKKNIVIILFLPF